MTQLLYKGWLKSGQSTLTAYTGKHKCQGRRNEDHGACLCQIPVLGFGEVLKPERNNLQPPERSASKVSQCFGLKFRCDHQKGAHQRYLGALVPSFAAHSMILCALCQARPDLHQLAVMGRPPLKARSLQASVCYSNAFCTCQHLASSVQVCRKARVV